MDNETILKSRIGASETGCELIEFLCQRFRYYSRHQWIEIIYEGRITVNGRETLPGKILENKDSVEFRTVLNEPPVDPGIRIIHEEEGFLAAVKPGNLPSHADGNFIKHTFVYILGEMLRANGFRGRARLVHRLDRETSGIMIVSKTLEAHRALSLQFQQGAVEKEYTAVVRGTVEADYFEISGSIVKDPDSSISIRRKLTADSPGSAASSWTKFRVIERRGGATVLGCRPMTGRTNQIRVHLAHGGHPLAGDKLYGRSDDEFLSFVNNVRQGNYETLPWLETSRHMLHAGGIVFTNPATGQRVSFSEPVPPDMENYIASL